MKFYHVTHNSAELDTSLLMSGIFCLTLLVLSWPGIAETQDEGTLVGGRW